MSKSTPGLLKAIGDFNVEHGGDKGHESTVALLSRVAGSLGPKASEDSVSSPGRKEAQMAAESGHDGGGGNTRSNRPGAADVGDPAPDQHEAASPSQMRGAGPVPSSGNIRSNLGGPSAQSGVIGDIRRQAALKELESGKSSGGNERSNPPAPPARKGTKEGDVKAPAKAPADTNKGAEFEGVPPFAKESIGGDGWSKAREKTKEMVAARK